jgi:hypothetical protein
MPQTLLNKNAVPSFNIVRVKRSKGEDFHAIKKFVKAVSVSIYSLKPFTRIAWAAGLK